MALGPSPLSPVAHAPILSHPTFSILHSPVAVAGPVAATPAIQAKRERVPVIEPSRGHVLPERSPAKQVKQSAPEHGGGEAESKEDADIRAKIKALEAQLLRRQRPAGGKAPPKPTPTPPPTLVPTPSSSLTSTTGATQNEHNRGLLVGFRFVSPGPRAVCRLALPHRLPRNHTAPLTLSTSVFYLFLTWATPSAPGSGQAAAFGADTGCTGNTAQGAVDRCHRGLQ